MPNQTALCVTLQGNTDLGLLPLSRLVDHARPHLAEGGGRDGSTVLGHEKIQKKVLI